MFFSFVRSMIRQIALLALGVATLQLSPQTHSYTRS